MSIQHRRTPHEETRDPSRARRGGFRVTESVAGVAGAIAAFLGLFILFAGEEQYVGVGGGISWRAGDISPPWAYGLLTGGAALMLVSAALVLRDRGTRQDAGRARPSGGADVLAHAAIFLLVNGFLWVQDIAIGGGLNYAYWITIPWGIALAGHVLAYVVSAHRQGQPGHTEAPGEKPRGKIHR